METTKKELSFFRLKLENYLSEHFPEMLSDKPFITARADDALTTYCDAVAQGFSHPEAETMASEVLHRGLHFSKYDTWKIHSKLARLTYAKWSTQVTAHLIC
jgi:hypothetical protein